MQTKPAAPLPVAQLLLLVGTAISVLIAGTEDALAVAVFLGAAGMAMFFVRPLFRPSMVPLVLLPLFCCLALAAFLPHEYFPMPEWRRLLAELGSVPLADSVSPQPWLGWFWWWLLAGTCFVFASLLTAPLETKPLALVLHGAALFVAVYASLAMFAFQTGWKYPFHGGAIFGFLPNRNHTATLLVVGSVLSFGLMQWRIARGDRFAAAFAALCGAPSLAALLFFSTSRAGVVFLIVGLCVWAIGASRSRDMRIRVLGAVAILAVFLGLLFIAGGSTVRDRLAGLWSETMSVQLEGGDKDVDFRQPVFRDTVRMIGDLPWSGAGMGQFRYVFPQYRKDSARAANVMHPESDWLMTAAESGIPSALVLLALLVWFVAVCWRSRSASGGMLRWTAASAVVAAALHGIIDVPWHRVSLGWFLLTVAASSVPCSGHPVRTPVMSRLMFVLGGLVLIAAAGWIAYENDQGRSPTPYAWPELSAEVQRLGAERRYDDGEVAAQKLVSAFPLRYESYYWQAGLLRAFEETGPEIEAAVNAGRAVEPVLAKVPAEQAVMLQPVDPDGAMEAWALAAERSAAIDEKEGRDEMPTAASYIDRAVTAFKGDNGRQLWFARRFGERPVLVAHWVTRADADAALTFLLGVADEKQFLDSLPPAQRQRVLARWITLSDAPRAVAFMEEREAMSPKGEYWPVLARYYASQGNLPGAVRRVASSCAITLQVPRVDDKGLRGEMAALIAQGNTVAARRLANDAVSAQKANPDDLAAAMAYFAAQGDWVSAWRAGSRLATEAKIGQ